MITTELMGPGFFIFFQTETIEPEVFSGGWEHHPWAYRKRKEEIKEEVIEIIEQIVSKPSKVGDKEKSVDMELALRLQLEVHEIAYKAVYLVWMNQKRRRKAAYFLLLH